MADVDDLVAEATFDKATARLTEKDYRNADGDTLWVCPFEKDGKVCGADFDTKGKLNSHAMGVHRLTWDGKPTKAPGRKAKDADQEPTTAPPKAERQAAKKATSHPGPLQDSNRAAVYAQSLSTIGVVAHLAAGRYFDDYDLDVWTRGSTPLAGALDSVGEQNPGLRRWADMLLAGGTGGAYVQLVMAATMIAVPIAAHHGWLPSETGQRFGAMLGMAASPPQAQPGPVVPAPSPDPAAPPSRLPVDAWTYDDWKEVLFAMPTSPTATQVMQDMMAGNVQGPTVVGVPDMAGTTPMDIPTEEHRGTVGTDNGAATPESVSP